MWWIILASAAGYLLAVRGTYGFVTWRGLLESKASRNHTAEENTRALRLLAAWLWPVQLTTLAVVLVIMGLTVFVTRGWKR